MTVTEWLVAWCGALLGVAYGYVVIAAAITLVVGGTSSVDYIV